MSTRSPSIQPKPVRDGGDGILGATNAMRRRADGKPSEPSGHGRSATTPSEIPARGWKDILWRIYNRISDDRIVALAAGVTFYALLAIFPAVAAVVSIFGLFSDPASISGQLDNLSGIVPGGAVDVIRDELGRLTSQGHATLGLAFAMSLAVSIWSANSGLKAVIDALNIVYAEREKRGLLGLNAVSLALTTGALLLALVAVASVIVLPLAMSYLGLESATQWIVAIVKWPALFLIVALSISVIYRYGPSRSKAKWRWITWGSAFATIGWLILSMLFSWYAANFGSYNKTYGSLGAVIGFMTWMWLSTIVILLGAELDAEMEHQTFRDTTEGSPKRMGQRGATMADSKGAAKE